MTAQVGEKLIMNNDELSMLCCPEIPEHPRIKERSKEEFLDFVNKLETRDQTPGYIPLLSTACWRRYIGTWEIKENRLYLVDVLGRFELLGDEPLFADWFSGTLRIPRGKLVKYVHSDFASIFEKELKITIEKGVVKETNIEENTVKQHRKE